MEEERINYTKNMLKIYAEVLLESSPKSIQVDLFQNLVYICEFSWILFAVSVPICSNMVENIITSCQTELHNIGI